MTRLVGVAGVALAAVAAFTLVLVVARSPETHDNLAPYLRAGYDRTPLDAVGLPPVPLPMPGFPGQGTAGAVPAAAWAPWPDEGAAAGAMSDAGVLQVAMVAFDYGFRPDRLRLKAGVPVELTVANDSGHTHGFWIPGFGVMEEVEPGTSRVFRFTPDRAATFRFSCSYSLCGTSKQHAAMQGVIVVE